MANINLNDYSLTPSQFEKYLELVIEMKAPTMVWGPAGVGKSSICRTVAEKIGAEYVDVRAIMLDPVDLRGIPYRDDKSRTRWAPPVFLPPEDSDKRYIINLEELPTAPPMVQAALYQLALDRKIGEYSLPAGASVIACGNREMDGGLFNRFSPALSSRFYHVELMTDAEDWRQWAIHNDISPQVIFFLQFKPDFLHQFNPKEKSRTFPCPRTWEYVSDIVKQNGTIDSTIERNILVGIVGEAAAIEFNAFLRVWRELPNPKKVLKNPDALKLPEGHPDRIEMPKNQSSLIALCGAIYRLADKKNFGNVVKFANFLRPELSEFLIGSCVESDKELQATTAFVEWAAYQNQKYG